MELCSNVEIGEDGKIRRKSKKYSSKGTKQTGGIDMLENLKSLKGDMKIKGGLFAALSSDIKTQITSCQ